LTPLKITFGGSWFHQSAATTSATVKLRLSAQQVLTRTFPLLVNWSAATTSATVKLRLSAQQVLTRTFPLLVNLRVRDVGSS